MSGSIPVNLSVFEDLNHYPGIVLHQPYAGLVRLASLGLPGKTIETRKTRISYRGPLVILASLSAYGDRFGWRKILGESLASRLDGVEPAVVEVAMSHMGEAIALFDVSDCRPLLPEDEPAAFFYEAKRWAWCSSRIRPLRPFRVQGHQGFVRVPRAAVDAAL